MKELEDRGLFADALCGVNHNANHRALDPLSWRPRPLLVTPELPLVKTLVFVLFGIGLMACSSTADSRNPSQTSSTETHLTSDDDGGEVDLFAPPKSMETLLDQANISTLMIQCGDSYGTGWVIDTAATPSIRPGYEGTYQEEGSSLLVTAHHVVDRCINKPETRLKAYVAGSQVPAEIVNWNRKDDIALLAIEREVPGLPVGPRPPDGAWAVSVGYPLDFATPVPLVGNVIASRSTELIAQMYIQPGSSGSPLLNSRGEVVATMKEMLLDSQGDEATGWSVANPTGVLCNRLFDCTTPITTTRVGTN
jgi:S1-C subfamily serine protease